MLCCGYTLTDFPISIRLTSLALWQSNDCPSTSKATLMNMDKYFMWIHYERLRDHNKAKHNKTVYIFPGIYSTQCLHLYHVESHSHDLHTSIMINAGHNLLLFWGLTHCGLHVAYDAILRHIYGITLAEVMACYLKAPGNYLNQWWLFISVTTTKQSTTKPCAFFLGIYCMVLKLSTTKICAYFVRCIAWSLHFISEEIKWFCLEFMNSALRLLFI